MEEHYSGCYKSLADYAEELTEDTSQIPENLAYSIDYERMGRDMELSGDIYTIEAAYEKVHVFWSHCGAAGLPGSAQSACCIHTSDLEV